MTTSRDYLASILRTVSVLQKEDDERLARATGVSTATHARQVSYGDNAGQYDLRTATCERHTLGSPTTTEAGTYPAPLPDSLLGAPCVVCPLPFSDLIGGPVLSWYDDSARPVTYGGPDSRDADRVCLAIGVGTGGCTRYCPADRVAPADTPLADAKDPRITVEKLPRKRSYQDAGVWLVLLPGQDPDRVTAQRTKKDALEQARRRLAILDWHVAQAAARQPEMDEDAL